MIDDKQEQAMDICQRAWRDMGPTVISRAKKHKGNKAFREAYVAGFVFGFLCREKMLEEEKVYIRQ